MDTTVTSVHAPSFFEYALRNTDDRRVSRIAPFQELISKLKESKNVTAHEHLITNKKLNELSIQHSV